MYAPWSFKSKGKAHYFYGSVWPGVVLMSLLSQLFFFFFEAAPPGKISNHRNTEEQPRWMEVIVVTVCRVSEQGRWGELMQTRELNLLKAKQKHRCRIYWTAAGAGLYTIYSIYKKKNTSSGSIFHSSLTSDGWIVPACKSYCPGSLTSLAMTRLSRIIWHGGPTLPFSTSKQEFEHFTLWSCAFCH